VEGYCEHGNEPSGSIKCWEVSEWLHKWQLLKKGSALEVGILFEKIAALPKSRILELYLHSPVMSSWHGA
jgi:hypothetical protein